jgi:hypothetical protein
VLPKPKRRRKEDRWVYEVVPVKSDWKDSGSIANINIVDGKRKSSMRRRI